MEVKSKYPKTVEPLLLRLVQILNSGKKNASAEKISRRKSSTSSMANHLAERHVGIRSGWNKRQA